MLTDQQALAGMLGSPVRDGRGEPDGVAVRVPHGSRRFRGPWKGASHAHQWEPVRSARGDPHVCPRHRRLWRSAGAARGRSGAHGPRRCRPRLARPSTAVLQEILELWAVQTGPLGVVVTDGAGPPDLPLRQGQQPAARLRLHGLVRHRVGAGGDHPGGRRSCSASTSRRSARSPDRTGALRSRWPGGRYTGGRASSPDCRPQALTARTVSGSPSPRTVRRPPSPERGGTPRRPTVTNGGPVPSNR